LGPLAFPVSKQEEHVLIDRRARYAPWCVLVGVALVSLPVLAPQANAQNAANYTATDLLPDETALVPLNDWMPLFGFAMTFSPDSPAPRILDRLNFRLKPDPGGTDRNYEVQSIVPTDIYQIGIFLETGPTEGVLDGNDRIVVGRAAVSQLCPGPFAGVPLIFDVNGNVVPSRFPDRREY
jgi:hypothetical protein